MSSLFALRTRSLPFLASSLCRPRVFGAACFEFARFISSLKKSNLKPQISSRVPRPKPSAQAIDLQLLLEKVKQNSSRRSHDGLKISYEDAIKASTEERHFKEIKEVCDSLRKLMLWRIELSESIVYEASEIEKQMKTRCDIEKGAVSRTSFRLHSSLEQQFAELLRNQESVAILLQKDIALLEQIKTSYGLTYKRALKLPLNPVKNKLETKCPMLPVAHQWEKKELPQELKEAITLFIQHQLHPLHRKCVRSLHLAGLKLEALEKRFSHAACL
jgi:hypothetical protein